MRKFTEVVMASILFFSLSLIIGCEGTVKKEEYEKVKAQAEQLMKDKADLEKRVEELTTEVNNLKTENEQLKSQIAAQATPTPPGETTPTPEGETQPQGTATPQAMPEENPGD
jgi:cell division protein FtsB